MILLKRLRFKLGLIRRRFRLWRICRAIGITPYKWQADFALGILDYPNYPKGRATGKTMAVMLRLLMQEQRNIIRVGYILRCDPDFAVMTCAELGFMKRNTKNFCISAGMPESLFWKLIGERCGHVEQNIFDGPAYPGPGSAPHPGWNAGGFFYAGGGSGLQGFLLRADGRFY